MMLGLFSCSSNSGNKKTSEKANRGYIVKVGEMAPDFEVALQDGKVLKLNELKGKVVMLQFTASWCSVCRTEMPFIESEIWQQHKGKDFYLLALARKDSKKHMLNMVEKTGIIYPITLDVADKAFTKYAKNEAGVTRNIIIDKKGKIRFLTRLFDRKEFDEMKIVIEKLLGE